MLGIDIVDLTDAQFKDRDNRALRLIQHPDDLTINHPHLYWLLWSAKESVFKCYREAINFSPTNIPIKLKWENEEVLFSAGHLNGKFYITDDYLLSLCSDDLKSLSFEVVKAEKTIDSPGLRNLIIEFFHNEGLKIQIGSDDLNLPLILPSNEPISISHHNHLGAFAYPTSITN